LVLAVCKEGAESITCRGKFEFGLRILRGLDVRDDNFFVCTDTKIIANYLISCVDAASIYGVECAGFSPHEP
jgi:hypothetical protein